MSSECQLLEPVCLRVTVARNLSSSWYQGCADVELHGRLQEISVDDVCDLSRFCCFTSWTDGGLSFADDPCAANFVRYVRCVLQAMSCFYSNYVRAVLKTVVNRFTLRCIPSPFPNKNVFIHCRNSCVTSSAALRSVDRLSQTRGPAALKALSLKLVCV